MIPEKLILKVEIPIMFCGEIIRKQVEEGFQYSGAEGLAITKSVAVLSENSRCEAAAEHRFDVVHAAKGLVISRFNSLEAAESALFEIALLCDWLAFDALTKSERHELGLSVTAISDRFGGSKPLVKS